jgi:hypothetical protein
VLPVGGERFSMCCCEPRAQQAVPPWRACASVAASTSTAALVSPTASEANDCSAVVLYLEPSIARLESGALGSFCSASTTLRLGRGPVLATRPVSLVRRARRRDAF